MSRLAAQTDIVTGFGNEAVLAAEGTWEPHRSANVPPPWQSPDKTRRVRSQILLRCRCLQVQPSRPNLTCRPSRSRLRNRRGPLGRRFPATPIRSLIFRRCPIQGRSRLHRDLLPSEVCSVGFACSLRRPRYE